MDPEKGKAALALEGGNGCCFCRDLKICVVTDGDDGMEKEDIVEQDQSTKPTPTRDGDAEQRVDDNLSTILWNLSLLSHLVIFSIIGVLIRYILEALGGSAMSNITSNHSPLFISLPPNMVGCFFMGWVKIIFKNSSSYKLLAIGLSSGLMGSITTLSSWIQEIVNLTTEGFWIKGLVGLLLGMELSYTSLILGMDSAKMLMQILSPIMKKSPRENTQAVTRKTAHKYQDIVTIISALLLWSGMFSLWNLDIYSKERRMLWLGCIVGPLGTWLRWLLARLNAKKLQVLKHVQWCPVGTLLANLIAVILMALLSTTDSMVKSQKDSIFIRGLELGFLGCLSTVSTMVGEVHTLRQSKEILRAYAYIFLTIIPSFLLSNLTYFLCIWIKQKHVHSYI